MEEQERSLWESHPFIWKYMYWIVLCYIFFTIVLIFAIWIYILAIVSLIAYAILAVPLLIQFYRWKRIFYRITEKRVIIRIGIFNINEKSVMIDKIENFQVERTIIDRILNTGDIVIYTETGQQFDAVLYDVPKIRTVEEILTELLSQRSE